VFNYAKSKYTHIYRMNLVRYTGHTSSQLSIKIFLYLGTVSRSNYAIIDYTMLQSPDIWNFPLASKAY
jgi:hypothetical protein